MPKRIQRKRTKGWKMPPNTVYVGRPTKWGNPFTVKAWGLKLCLRVFRNTVQGCWEPSAIAEITNNQCANMIYGEHCEWLKRAGPATRIEDNLRAELRCKDLACWCPLNQPCHADVLLEIANAARAEGDAKC